MERTSAQSATDRAGDRIVSIVERVLALGLIGAILLDVMNVVGRYTGAYSVIGIDEVEIFTLIWMAFLGAVAVTWRRQHLRMDVFLESCRPATRRVIQMIEMAVMLVVTAFLGWQSFAYTSRMFILGSPSDIAGIPMWIPHSALCVSFFAMAAITLVRAVQLFSRPHSDIKTSER